MTDSIRPAIRQFLGGLMQSSDEIKVSDAADLFIAEHEDAIRDHLAGMIRRDVGRELRALCAEREEDTGQLAFLPGIPAGIAVSPGVVRPRNRCTWADLEVGRQERVQNIAHAEKALDAYDRDLDRLRPLLADRPELTVADVRDQLDAS